MASHLPFVSAACLATLLAASAPRAQFDLTIADIEVLQVIPGVTMIAGKTTMVRTQMDIAGTMPSGTEVEGVMRVFVNGVEASFSPVYTDNGPIEPPTNFNRQMLRHTLNFIFIPPESNDVVMTVEINPAGPNQVAETNLNNNTSSTPQMEFVCKGKPDLVYVPIDYRPSGGGPNLPNEAWIQPGAGDNFIQAIFPTADWEYRLVEAGSKLWTGNLSGSGSALLSSLRADRNLMNPRPDKVYGWVPGSLPYNGVATLNGTAAMGNTQTIRHQRTFAHELGHLFGRNHINNTIQVVGVDIEHHLNITQGLSRVMPPNKNDVMVAGLLTNQAWCYATNYQVYVNRNEFSCNNDEASRTSDLSDSPNLLLSGTWNRIHNSIELMDLVTFHGGAATEFVPVDGADLIVRAYGENGLLGEFGLACETTADCSAEHDAEAEEDEGEGGTAGDSAHPQAPIESFCAVLPRSVDPNAIQKLTIFEPGAGAELLVVNRSDAAPQVDLVSPVGSLGDQVEIEFKVSDADSPQTKHYVRYSSNGERITPIATNRTGTRFSVDMTTVPAFVEGKGFFEILATDGLNTTRVLTGGLTNDGVGNNPPSTFILTPDPGKTFRFGATIPLHASGWDLEDNAIEGSSLVWTSDIDGQIATGRMTSVADLSVGTHVITVTATDSGGLTETDTETVIISSRILPGETCQQDLGGGGPGTLTATLCGSGLNAGESSDYEVTGAEANATGALLISTANQANVTLFPAANPGTLVSGAGILLGVPISADGSGNVSLTLTGLSTQVDLVLQSLLVDSAVLPHNVAFSNAILAEYGQ